MTPRSATRPLAAGALAACLAAAGAAHAAGFAIVEQGVAGLGSAYAGAAAHPTDASTIAYNPAGLALLHRRQLVLAGHAIRPRTELQTGATASAPPGGGIDPDASPGAGLGGDAGVSAFVPGLFAMQPLSDAVTAGLGIYAPFGLATEYDPAWIGRFLAIRSELETVSLVPAVAVKASERLALGAGLHIQRAEATLSNAVDYEAVNPLFAGQEGVATLKGDAWGFGVELGGIYTFEDGTRLGLAYRSGIRQSLEGRATFTNTPAALAALGLFVDSRVTAAIDLPARVMLSVAVPRGRWTFLADASWTQWSRFDRLVVYYLDSNQPPTVTPEDWRDSWRFSVGFDYRHSDAWTLRAGLAYDQTPIPDAEHRTPRIPGNDRRWLAVGASYHGKKNLRLDVGYAHLFVSDTPIRNSSTQGHLLVGTYESSVDILSAQLVWQME